MLSAVVVPVDGPIQTLDVPDSNALSVLQGAVGGNIEALPFLRDDVTCYINEDGKYVCRDEDDRIAVNRRATLLLKSLLFPGDFIAGPLVIVGFNPSTGEHTELPGELLAKLTDPNFGALWTLGASSIQLAGE